MANLKSGLILGDGEQLVMELEAEMWPMGNTLTEKIAAQTARFWGKWLGTKKKGFLVMTNKRVILVNDTIKFWCINADRSVDYILASHVRDLGYKRDPLCCGLFCPQYQIYLTTFTTNFRIIMKEGVDEASVAKAADIISQFVSKASVSAV